MKKSSEPNESTNVALLRTTMAEENNSSRKKEVSDGIFIELYSVMKKPNSENIRRDSNEKLEGTGFCHWAELLGDIVSKHGKHVINFAFFVGYIVYLVFAVRFDPEGSVFVCVLCSLLILRRIIRTLKIDVSKLLHKAIDKVRTCLPKNVRKSKTPRM